MTATIAARPAFSPAAAGDSSDLLEQALRELRIPAGDTFYWIATESRRARNMRLWLGQERGIPKDWMKAKGYWKAGADEDGEDD